MIDFLTEAKAFCEYNGFDFISIANVKYYPRITIGTEGSPDYYKSSESFTLYIAIYNPIPKQYAVRTITVDPRGEIRTYAAMLSEFGPLPTMPS